MTEEEEEELRILVVGCRHSPPAIFSPSVYWDQICCIYRRIMNGRECEEGRSAPGGSEREKIRKHLGRLGLAQFAKKVNFPWIGKHGEVIE